MNLLIRKAKKHDRAAFQELMEQQGKAMYKVAKAILKNDEDAADAMQETALVCWEKIDTLKKDKYFQTWLMRILINNCNAIWRQRARMIAGGEVPEAAFSEEGYANAEWEQFLNCLDEKYRTVIVLYYVQGFKTRELAEILEILEHTVGGRLVTARKKLEVQYRSADNIIRQAEFTEKRLFCMAERRI